jgi:ribonuclease HII
MMARERGFDPANLPDWPDLSFEQPLWAAGVRCIGGVDEAGRGAWAGPVAAAVVFLPPDPQVEQLLHGVRDSKQMSPEQRAGWAPRIRAAALDWGVGFASSQEIDQEGILPATRLAALRAIGALERADLLQHLLLDYLVLPAVDLPQTPLIKGDSRSLSIAAASVLAKTARDALLCEMEDRYPGYHFAAHKGYGTPAHQLALRQLGPCAIHRASFAPVRERLQRTDL